MRLGPERKFPVSQDATFLFAFADGYPSAAPTLSVAFTVPWSGALAAVRAADTVSAFGNDRVSITISTAGTQAATIPGIPGDFAGEAWLVGPGVSCPVQVKRLVSDASGAGVLELASPLPDTAAYIATTTLRWTLYYVTIPAATIGASVQRFVRWSLPWTRTQGSSATAEIRTEFGILHVVRNPFDTGLTDAELRTYVPGIDPFSEQQSWHAQREAAHDELVEWLRAGLAADQYEDQAPGAMFRAVHALLTAALIFDGFDGQGRQGAAADAVRCREQAKSRFDRIMSRLTFLDLDADGVVDTGETDIMQQGLGGLAVSSATDSSLVTNDDPDDATVLDLVGIQDAR